jgi:putative methionine-R-sulfoxide reductase with GAF domain
MPADSASRWGPAGSHADITERALLQSVVEVARWVFGAAAASVFLLDEEADELVFEAVAGEGEDHLVGTRFPSGTGLAGWVVMSGQAVLVDDVAQSPQFARDAAESTGYVPRSIMAAPLIRSGECIGVLEVLDRGSNPRGDLSDVDLIGMLATEVALGLELLLRLRWHTGQFTGGQPSTGQPSTGQPSTGQSSTGQSSTGRRAGAGKSDLDVLQRVAERLPYATEPVASTVGRLLAAADDLLAAADADTPGVSR